MKGYYNDQKVAHVLNQKEQSLERQRCAREKITEEKARQRQRNIEFDYSKREQYAESWVAKEAKWVDRIVGEHNRA